MNKKGQRQSGYPSVLAPFSVNVAISPLRLGRPQSLHGPFGSDSPPTGISRRVLHADALSLGDHLNGRAAGYFASDNLKALCRGSGDCETLKAMA